MPKYKVVREFGIGFKYQVGDVVEFNEDVSSLVPHFIVPAENGVAIQTQEQETTEEQGSGTRGGRRGRKRKSE